MKTSFFDRLKLALRVFREKPIAHDSLFVHKLHGILNVERKKYLMDKATGRGVLHFGYLDTPFLLEKIESKTMLHEHIKDVAKVAYGVDVNEIDLAQYREITGDERNMILDISSVNFDPSIFGGIEFDLILFPEVLEHIASPGLALRNLRELCIQHSADLIITVPNAYNFNFFVEACSGIEIVHPDHFFYFSPVTLRRLVEISGFEVEEIKTYGPQEFSRRPGFTEFGVICLAKPKP